MCTRLKAAAEPLPDDPHNEREDATQATRVPDVLTVGNFLAMKYMRMVQDVSPSTATRSSECWIMIILPRLA